MLLRIRQWQGQCTETLLWQRILFRAIIFITISKARSRQNIHIFRVIFKPCTYTSKKLIKTEPHMFTTSALLYHYKRWILPLQLYEKHITMPMTLLYMYVYVLVCVCVTKPQKLRPTLVRGFKSIDIANHCQWIPPKYSRNFKRFEMLLNTMQSWCGHNI